MPCRRTGYNRHYLHALNDRRFERKKKENTTSYNQVGHKHMLFKTYTANHQYTWISYAHKYVLRIYIKQKNATIVFVRPSAASSALALRNFRRAINQTQAALPTSVGSQDKVPHGLNSGTGCCCFQGISTTSPLVDEAARCHSRGTSDEKKKIPRVVP